MDGSEFAGQNSLIFSLLCVGALMLAAQFLSRKVTGGRIHPSAFSIVLGLAAAYVGGLLAHGSHGLADIAAFSSIGILGGSALRDFTVVAVSYGADIKEFWKYKGEMVGALLFGVALSYFSAIAIALLMGYRDGEELTVLAAGAVTFIVGPVTASALGVTSNVVAISIAIGVIKSIAIMLLTPVTVRRLGLASPRFVMLYGGMLGSTSGVAAGLMAVDDSLVPYGTLATSFYMGVGCLLCPTVLYSLTCVLTGWIF